MESAIKSHDTELPVLHRSVSQEALWITFICCLDLATTLYWVSQGHAREGNPLMAWFLHRGHVPFIGAKLLTFVPAVVLAEWYRPRNPVLIGKLLRWTIIFYLFIYVAGVLSHYGRVLDFYHRLLLS
jgi:hypothetical protein